MASSHSPPSPSKRNGSSSSRRQYSGDRSSSGFFKLGEIRPPKDEDFDHLLRLAENHEKWLLKHDKNGVRVWMREIPGQTVKMLKVKSNRRERGREGERKEEENMIQPAIVFVFG
uniref:START domain-containing protein n=1 Tax=Amphimedon queenslandica TaxID=400682 RepID=A0A1X7T9R1_AMPQE